MAGDRNKKAPRSENLGAVDPAMRERDPSREEVRPTDHAAAKRSATAFQFTTFQKAAM